MKTKYSYLSFLLAVLCLGACQQEEVKTFSGERGINFVCYDDWSKSYEDDYTKLTLEHNFFEDYAEQGWELSDYTQEIGIQLEGTFSDTPITVKVKVEAVDGYEMPTLELPEECVIEAGEYQSHFEMKCKKPAEFDKVYKARLVFDYSASGLVSGTKERQAYEITLSDATPWSDMYVSNETEWNTAYASVLGNYGPMKARCLFVGLGTSEYGGAYYYGAGRIYTNIRTYFYNQKNGWSGGFTGRNSFVGYYLDDTLYLYEEVYGKELQEADGTTVAFNI